MKIPLVAVAALALALAGLPARGDEPTGSETVLAPGPPVTGAIAGGETRRFRLDLDANDFVRAVVEQRGVDVALVLRGPGGGVVLERNRQPARVRREGFAIVIEVAGPYVLEVRAAIGEPAGAFTVGYTRRNPALSIARAEAAADAGAQAPELLARLRDESRVRGDRNGEGMALYQLGVIEARDDVRDLSTLEAARALFHEIDEPDGEALAVIALGDARDRLGDKDAALVMYREGLSIAEAQHDNLALAYLLSKVGLVRSSMGQAEAALDDFTRARALFAAGNHRVDEARSVNNIGRVLKMLGQLDEAQVYAEEALALSQKAGGTDLRIGLMINLGDLQHRRGDLAAAERTFQEAAALAEQARTGEMWAMALNRQASLWLDRREAEPEVAAQILRAVLSAGQTAAQVARQMRLLDVEAESATVVGMAFRRQGQLDAAAASLTHALKVRERLHAPHFQADILVELARVERDRDHLDQALVHAQAAVDLVEALRNDVSDADRRASFLASRADVYAVLRRHPDAPASSRSPDAGHDAAALQVSERARARVLLEALIEARADIRAGRRSRAARTASAALQKRSCGRRRTAWPARHRARGARREAAAQAALRAAGRGVPPGAVADPAGEPALRRADAAAAGHAGGDPARGARRRHRPARVLSGRGAQLPVGGDPHRAGEPARLPARPQIEARGTRACYGLLTARQRDRAALAVERRTRGSQARVVAPQPAPAGPARRAPGPDWKGKRLLIVASGRARLPALRRAALPRRGAARPLLAATTRSCSRPSASVLLAAAPRARAGAAPAPPAWPCSPTPCSRPPTRASTTGAGPAAPRRQRRRPIRR